MNLFVRTVNSTLKKSVIILLIIISGCSFATAQDNILETHFTFKFDQATISTILKSVSRRTGYHFTYDTDFIEPARTRSLRIDGQALKTLLDTLFYDITVDYSVIEDHIIIYRPVNESSPLIEEKGKESVYHLSGLISSAENGQPLPYATIGIKSKGKGTVTNFEGEYDLNITKEFLDDTLIVSYLGFYSRVIPVKQAISSYFNIELSRKFIPIPEVIIRNRQPLELILKTKQNIADNYGRTPAAMTAFYRESVSKKTKILLYSEAVIELYKSSYATTLFNDQVKIVKSRKISNLDPSDTLIFKLKSGLDGALSLDGAKNIFDFLKTENLDDYNYNMVDIINIGDEAAFVIEFAQKKTIASLALPKGLIYINTNNYGIHAAEFEINETYLDKFDRSVIQREARGYRVRVRSLKYRVNYRYINGRYFLSHVRGDLEFYARKKNKLFGSSYDIFFEMAVNDIDTMNVDRFTREERAPVHSIFSETIESYDPRFWGTDNYVRPEESIEEALSRINARMSRYRANNSQ